MIRFENVHKAFGPQKILHGVNLTFPKGKISVVIGRSGAGKSVVLKHIMGFLKPDQGKVFIDGQDSSDWNANQWRDKRKKFGMLFQDSALFDSMNVWENVAFPLLEHTDKSREEIDEIVRRKLRLVGLVKAETKRPADLSGGMRKRVGLARAIALDPDVVLFDEPSSGLDPIVTSVIDQLILDTQKETGCTYVVISHDMNSVYHIADQISMIYEGQVVAQGTPEEIRNSDDALVHQFVHGELEGPFNVYY
ncbi:MAG: ABC transporter ATP-binding protein [bacterium]|nr:ABC transporter ATP-binding protein [bacterium]